MKRFASIIAASLAIAVASAQSVSIHTSGGDATQWALIRVQSGQTAHVGDIDGIHIGEVTRDELIIVRNHKASVVTDGNVLTAVEQSRAPVDRLRDEHLKLRGAARDARLEQRNIERERRNLQREKQQAERNLSRATEDRRHDFDQTLKDIGRRERDLERKLADATSKVDAANKRVEAIDREREAAREQYYKKVERIIDDAIARGLAHPLE